MVNARRLLKTSLTIRGERRLLYGDRDPLRHDRRIEGFVVPVGEHQLEGMFSGRELDNRLSLSASEVEMLRIVGDGELLFFRCELLINQ